jgi:hypothetical protein
MSNAGTRRKTASTAVERARGQEAWPGAVLIELGQHQCDRS